eukprot:14708608-Alexandrium_andersonii.AAC.1
MSASLVGSEMCIRDRVTDLELSEERPRVGLFDGLHASPGLLGDEVSSQPVSYTHLTLPTICSV